jgi:hypothetical protein
MLARFGACVVNGLLLGGLAYTPAILAGAPGGPSTSRCVHAEFGTGTLPALLTVAQSAASLLLARRARIGRVVRSRRQGSLTLREWLAYRIRTYGNARVRCGIILIASLRANVRLSPGHGLAKASRGRRWASRRWTPALPSMLKNTDGAVGPGLETIGSRVLLDASVG